MSFGLFIAARRGIFNFIFVYPYVCYTRLTVSTPHKWVIAVNMVVNDVNAD